MTLPSAKAAGVSIRCVIHCVAVRVRGDAISEDVRKESSHELAERLSRMSVEELADYFDSNFTAEMPLESTEEVEVEKDELEQVSLRLPAQDLAELRRQAAEKGIGYTTLIRMILREHLRAPAR